MKNRLKMKDIRLKTWSFGLKLFFASLAILLFACQDVQRPTVPENLISKEKMTSILVDVYISNAARSVNNRILIDRDIKLDSIIYEKYSIDSLQFVLSNDYYSSNLNSYSDIISDAKERLTLLNEEKDSIYKLIKKEKGDTITSNTIYKRNTLIDPAESKSTDSLQLKSLK